MNRALAIFFALAIGLALAMSDAEAARRLGGGKSSGMQRDSSAMKRETAPQSPTNAVPARPAQPTPAPAPQPSGMSRWLGPLAGLAAGVGLAALFSHFGMGEGFASVAMMLLIGLAAVFVIRLLFRRRQPESQALQYAGGVSPGPLAYEAPAPSATQPPAAAAANVPAGFDVDGFLRQAKLNFVRLQAANDAKNIDDIRNFTSPEMFAEIKLQMDERGNAPQQTDVVTLNAELIEVTGEAGRHIASVRFFGAIRESEAGAPEAFDEVWHLAKPLDGSGGWVIAGIQQIN